MARDARRFPMEHDHPFVWPDDLERILGEVWEFARRCGVEDHRLEDALAEDIAQEVATRLWNKRKTIRFSSWKPLRVYVAQMVRREIIKWAGKRRRTPISHVEDLDSLAVSMDTIGTGLTLDDCLKLLQNPMQREAFRLKFGEELGYEEIGKRLGIAVGTAHKLVKSAKTLLRQKLGDRFEKHMPDASQAER